MRLPPFTGILALISLHAALVATASAGTVVIAVSNGTTPGENGVYGTFFVPSISNSGQVAFHSLLSGTSGGGTDFRGLFRGNGSGDLQLVRQGQAAPDGNGNFSAFKNPALNNNDVAAFLAQMSGTTGGTSDDWGIFRGDGLTAPVRIVREGQSLPDNVGVFSSFGEYFALNDSGHVAFTALIDLQNGGSVADQIGIFRGDGVTGPIKIARKGESNPLGDGTYSNFYDVTLNESGQVAFQASLTGTTGGSNDNEAVFRGDGVNPTVKIVREDQPVADGNGEFYIFSHPRINDAGQVAFWANLRSTTGGDADNLGIFRGDGVTDPVTIVRRGQTVPGGTDTFSMFGIETMNNAGQVAVTAEINLNNGGGTSDESALIIGSGTPGSLIVVAREGQPVPGGTDTFLSFGAPALNQAGQLAFRAFVSEPGGFYNLGLYFYDPTEGLFQICREDAPFLGSTLDSFTFFNTEGYNTDGRTGLNDAGEVAFLFQTTNGKQGIARWSTAPGPIIPLQITKFQIQADPWNPWGPSIVRLEWTSPYEATSFNIRSSADLSTPPSSWPIFAGPIPRDEPFTSFETYLDPFFFPPKLFFVVEQLE
jgi:hypothetical protein